jgi:hypothetical protein
MRTDVLSMFGEQRMQSNVASNIDLDTLRVNELEEGTLFAGHN